MRRQTQPEPERSQESPKDDQSDADPTPPRSSKPKPLMVQAELRAERAAIRARRSKEKADEAVDYAKSAALTAQEMRKSLRRLHSMVKDAALTAGGLPENRDDEANAQVAVAQREYREAYAAVKQCYTFVNARVNRAFWVSQYTTQAVAEAKSQKAKVLEQLRVSGERGASPEEMAALRKEEKRWNPDRERAASRVDSQAARFFRSARPSKTKATGVAADSKFDSIPAAPPYNPPPPDTRGQLRPYQEQLYSDIKATGEREPVLVVAPTGAGKTRILAEYIKDLRAQDKKVAILAHREELLDQGEDAVAIALGLDSPTKAARELGWVQGRRAEWGKPVTVISHGSVSDNPFGAVPHSFKPDVLIIDEAHHAAAEGFQSIINAIGPKKLVGFTATPYRTDDRKLGDTFDRTICRVETNDLIEKGYLVPPTVVDVDLKDSDGKEVSINQANNLPEIYAEAIARARGNGRKKIIVFVSGGPGQGNLPTDVVKQTSDALANLGVNAGEVLGSTDPKDRAEAVKKFRRRDDGILVNYGTLNEGFDAPDTDAIILGRNTGNPGTLAQIVGRGMRAAPGKRDVLVLNYSNRSGQEVKRLVVDQVHGNRKDKIDCDAPPAGSRGAQLAAAVRREREKRSARQPSDLARRLAADLKAQQQKKAKPARRRRSSRRDKLPTPGPLPKIEVRMNTPSVGRRMGL